MTGFKTIASYQLDIYAPETEPEEAPATYRWAESHKRVLSNLPAMIESLEEDLCDLLPEGYLASAKELR